MLGSSFCLSFSISGSDPIAWLWKALLCCRIGIQPFRAIPFLPFASQNFLIYMMFLLVVLLTNYGDASRTSRAFLLQSSIKQQLGSNDFLLIKRYLPAPGGQGSHLLGLCSTVCPIRGTFVPMWSWVFHSSKHCLWFCCSPGEQRGLWGLRSLISLRFNDLPSGKGLWDLMLIFLELLQRTRVSLSPKFRAISCSHEQGHKSQK